MSTSETHTLQQAGSGPDVGLLARMYETALTIRLFEQRAIGQYRLGNIRGYLHPYTGEEAIAVGVMAALEPTDYIVSTHRGHGHAIAKGHEPRLMMAELLGRADGYCHGRGGSMHVASKSLRNLGANGVVAGGMNIAAGAAMAIKMRGEQDVVISFCSDGAANNGAFHEALNLAAIYHLPVIFVLENNHYAVSTKATEAALIENLSERAAGYGMPGVTVDGNDAVVVMEAMREPLRRARAGEGPSLVECSTYRHGGHHVNDPGLYLPREELERWKAHDPLIVLRERLAAAGADESLVPAIDARVEALLDEAVEFALASPQPSVEAFLLEISAA
ncbi:MAG: thiamine pyrophosphate-dependent dehydrogenase E1 component subunit alpha [Candidatus Limnocylindrales bacterium]